MAYAETWALVLAGEFDAAEAPAGDGGQIFSTHQ